MPASTKQALTAEETRGLEQAQIVLEGAARHDEQGDAAGLCLAKNPRADLMREGGQPYSVNYGYW